MTDGSSTPTYPAAQQAVESSTMNDPDIWYVRLPDGRVGRLRTTQSVRSRISRGKIPPDSLVRRSKEDDWATLAWTEEFADLAHPPSQTPLGGTPRLAKLPELDGPVENGRSGDIATVASRLDPLQLRTVGISAWAQELVAALDSLLVFKKLLITMVAGGIFGLGLLLFRSGLVPETGFGLALDGLALGLFGLLVFVVASSLLTLLTYAELSHLRPARWRDGYRGLTKLSVRLFLTSFLTIGIPTLLLAGLVHLSGLLLGAGDRENSPWNQLGPDALAVGSILVGLLLPVLLHLGLLQGPLLVVEGGSTRKALVRWLVLLFHEGGRIVVCQGLALVFGLFLTMPGLFLVLLAGQVPLDSRLLPVKAGTMEVLLALVLAPGVAYLVIANLFIYLNLRFGAGRLRSQL